MSSNHMQKNPSALLDGRIDGPEEARLTTLAKRKEARRHSVDAGLTEGKHDPRGNGKAGAVCASRKLQPD